MKTITARRYVPNETLPLDEDQLRHYIYEGISKDLIKNLVQILDTEEEIVVQKTKFCTLKSQLDDSTIYEQKIHWDHLIRCIDCEHNMSSPDAGNAQCEFFYGMTDQYGYCHHAERRE